MRFISFFVLFIISANLHAQPANPAKVFVRHDTTQLKADEGEWIIKSLTRNDPKLTSQIGKSVPEIILNAIASGKLKAFDRATEKQIPAKEIYTWHMPGDTIAVMDADGNNMKYQVIQRRINPKDISQARIYHDWYFDINNGKTESVIKWIDLMMTVRMPDGTPRGSLVFCRIYY